MRKKGEGGTHWLQSAQTRWTPCYPVDNSTQGRALGTLAARARQGKLGSAETVREHMLTGLEGKEGLTTPQAPCTPTWMKNAPADRPPNELGRIQRGMKAVHYIPLASGL
jgi:hypothetical protein